MRSLQRGIGTDVLVDTRFTFIDWGIDGDADMNQNLFIGVRGDSSNGDDVRCAARRASTGSNATSVAYFAYGDDAAPATTVPTALGLGTSYRLTTMVLVPRSNAASEPPGSACPACPPATASFDPHSQPRSPDPDHRRVPARLALTNAPSKVAGFREQVTFCDELMVVAPAKLDSVAILPRQGQGRHGSALKVLGIASMGEPMSRFSEQRVSGPVTTAFVSLLAMAGAGCGHGNSQSETAVASSAGSAAAQTCRQGGKPSDDCCAAMMDEGDTLLAAGNKQGAYDKYEETRSACVKFHPVRKRIFLVTRNGPVEEPRVGPTRDVHIIVDFDLHLAEDVGGIGHASYLDGEPVETGQTIKGLRPGEHHLAIEVYVNPVSGQGLSPVRLDVHQPVILSPSLVGQKLLVGGAKVRISDRGGAGTLQERLSFGGQPIDFDTVVMLQPRAGSELLITDITKIRTGLVCLRIGNTAQASKYGGCSRFASKRPVPSPTSGSSNPRISWSTRSG